MIYEDFINKEFWSLLSQKNKDPELSFYTINKNVLPLMGSFDLEAIRPAHVKEVLNCMLLKRFHNMTIYDAYALMKRSFQLAISQELIHRNPCIFYFYPCDGSRYTYPEDLETHERIVASIEKLPHRNIYGFCYMTGLSVSQLLLLHYDAYDRDSHLLTVSTERIKGRYLIPDCALPYLEAEMNKRNRLTFVENDLLFSESDGTKLRRDQLSISSHMLKISLRKPDFTARDLSRAYGNMLRLTKGDDWH